MLINLEQYSNGSAGRHETFVPRYGWLTKGYVKALEDPDVFKVENAVEVLGVGKNMVRSIRYWCILFGLLEKNKTELISTKFGEMLIGKINPNNSEFDWSSGFDPFLEDDASLWLLHWQIFLNPLSAVSWVLFFNYCSLQKFTRQDLSKNIVNFAKGNEKLSKISSKSFEKDANCIIQMYVPNINSDFGIKCPFTNLNLIEKTTESSHFKFNFEKKNSLHPLIFLATCCSYANKLGLKEKTFSLNKIVYGQDSPGIAFKLTETECGTLIEDAVSKIDNINFVESSGTQQLHFSQEPIELYWEILEKYYNRE
ncbi:MAG: DUF4007 family protein [Desulforegulaceae bacterium]|nr:DUF4007 family protein [Desulforegulaceae bacterium]